MYICICMHIYIHIIAEKYQETTNQSINGKAAGFEEPLSSGDLSLSCGFKAYIARREADRLV